MSTPDWFEELLGVSHLLAAEDRIEIDSWGGDAGSDAGDQPPAGAEEQDHPLTPRLAALAHAFVKHAAELTPDQHRRMWATLEGVLTTGTEKERDAVATGFLEALLAAWDKDFDLQSVWSHLGPEARAYCVAWNSFAGVESPDWMRED